MSIVRSDSKPHGTATLGQQCLPRQLAGGSSGIARDPHLNYLADQKLALRAVGVFAHQRAAGSVHAHGPSRQGRAIRHFDTDRPAGRDLAVMPAGNVEVARTQPQKPRLEARKERIEEFRCVDADDNS